MNWDITLFVFNSFTMENIEVNIMVHGEIFAYTIFA